MAVFSCRFLVRVASVAGICSFSVFSAQAQTATDQQMGQSGRILVDSISPFAAGLLSAEEVSRIEMPQLDDGQPSSDGYEPDKYFYFHRSDTDVPAAYADIVECDGYAANLSSGMNYAEAPYPYTGTMAGAVGGAIGNAMVDAIYGSAERRRIRRVNMRACMGFKGYERYPLSKSLWTKFNFEEGFDSVALPERQRAFRVQALVASKAVPVGEVLEP